MDEEPTHIIVCQGPPRCDLRGDEAIACQQAGCVWCERITIHPCGAETREGPTSQ